MNWYRCIVSTILPLLALLVSGCHTVNSTKAADLTRLAGHNDVYIVQSNGKERGFLKEMERNLKGRGFNVSAGPMDRMGDKVELYFTYFDRWKWDMVMYPYNVKMAFYDAKTREVLGSSEFKNNWFHTFPDPPEITDELLGRIFGEPEGRYMK